MSVIHILKDGTRLDDITGHVVKMSDAKELYTLLESVNNRRLRTVTKKIHTNKSKRYNND